MTSLVASVDAAFTRYTAVAEIQLSREEIISNLGSRMETMLNEYFQYNKKTFPETMVFFRDGVSEGVYEEVFQKELGQLDELFTRLQLEGPKRPKLITTSEVRRKSFIMR